LRKKPSKRKILLTIFVFFIVFFLSTDTVIYIHNLQASTPNIVRVAVAKGEKQVSLQIKGPYQIFALPGNELIESGKYLAYSVVSPLASGIKIAEKDFGIYGVRIVPKRDSAIYLNRRSLRGIIDLIRTEDMRLLAVNHIDVEDYLRGVLYNEVSHWWPIESLKAQAIAARTYALYQKKVSAARDYDLTSGVSSQVYGGKFSEKWRTDRAVRLTKNKVLTYKWKIFPTYYHATCSGHTEDASNLWNVDMEPLKGTKCHFCKVSPHYRWKKEILLSEIEAKLRKAGYNIGKINSITPGERFVSGRIKDIELVSPTALLTIPAKLFRSILGNNFIRSTNFKIRIKKPKAFFEGLGWGHGVGMCQWGAYSMAKRHFKAIEILRFYYPGSKIRKFGGAL